MVDRSVKPEIISYFPVHELPEDVTERFVCTHFNSDLWHLDFNLKTRICDIHEYIHLNFNLRTQIYDFVIINTLIMIMMPFCAFIFCHHFATLNKEIVDIILCHWVL